MHGANYCRPLTVPSSIRDTCRKNQWGLCPLLFTNQCVGSLVARGNPQPPDLNDSPDDINLQNNINKSCKKDIHLKVANFTDVCTLIGHILLVI